MLLALLILIGLYLSIGTAVGAIYALVIWIMVPPGRMNGWAAVAIGASIGAAWPIVLMATFKKGSWR